jgi:hypothetical protein
MCVALVGTMVAMPLCAFAQENQPPPAQVGDVSRSGISTNRTDKMWSYWKHAPIGVTLPYPRGWVVDQQRDKVIIHEPSPKTIDGSILALGVTFINANFSGSQLASLGDEAISRKFVDNVLSQGNKRSLSREDIVIASGQHAILFSHSYRKGDTEMKAVCLVAVVDLVLYYVDVTGIPSRIDSDLASWKSMVCALEVRK